MQAARSSPYAKGYGKKGPPSIPFPGKKRKEKGGEGPLLYSSRKTPDPLLFHAHKEGDDANMHW